MRTPNCLVVATVALISFYSYGAEPSAGDTAAMRETQGTAPDAVVNVRYMVDNVDDAIGFYVQKLGFTLTEDSRPAFAAVVRGRLRLLLSGEKSSADVRCPMGLGQCPAGGTGSNCLSAIWLVR